AGEFTVGNALTVGPNADLSTSGTLTVGGDLVTDGGFDGTGQVTRLTSPAGTLSGATPPVFGRLAVEGGYVAEVDFELVDSGAALTVPGSLDLRTNDVTVTFAGGGAQSAAGLLYHGLTIDSGASVSLLADAAVEGTLALVGGQLNIGVQILTLEG